MVKVKQSAVFKYFSKSDTTKYFICQVKVGEDICNAKIDEKTFNLKRHLEQNHPEIYKEVDSQDRENNTLRSKNQSLQNSSNPVETIAKFFQNKRVTVSMTKDKFKQHIIEMVVENGIPLTFFSSKGFLGLNGELAGKLGLSLERHEIRKMVITAAIDRKHALKVTNLFFSKWMAAQDTGLAILP